MLYSISLATKRYTEKRSKFAEWLLKRGAICREVRVCISQFTIRSRSRVTRARHLSKIDNRVMLTREARSNGSKINRARPRNDKKKKKKKRYACAAVRLFGHSSYHDRNEEVLHACRRYAVEFRFEVLQPSVRRRLKPRLPGYYIVQRKTPRLEVARWLGLRKPRR
ncbi:hypothetical protein PUN28_004851 [Cardiocondyla obscurior]|uniref:Uncharacterized protein n=1 Tax=Cardiocondyla obscurior TaxID=286306 RepID=A0AAW2GCV1_9HYME